MFQRTKVMELIKINIILKVILGILVKMNVEIALTHEWSKKKTTVRDMEQGIDQSTGDLPLWELMKRVLLKNDMCLEFLLDIRTSYWGWGYCIPQDEQSKDNVDVYRMNWDSRRHTRLHILNLEPLTWSQGTGRQAWEPLPQE